MPKTPQRPARIHQAKGLAARDRFKQAALSLLNRHSRHELKVTALATEAGVANGLFYHYFDSLDELVAELVEEFIARLEAVDHIEQGVPKGDWFARTLAHYRQVVDCYADFPGLMRCVQDLSSDDPGLRERWRQSYLRQLDWLVEALPRAFPGTRVGEREARMLVYGLGSVGEQLLRGIYIEKDERLLSLGSDREAIAEWLTALYYRGLFGGNPPPEQLSHAAILQHLQRTP